MKVSHRIVHNPQNPQILLSLRTHRCHPYRVKAVSQLALNHRSPVSHLIVRSHQNRLSHLNQAFQVKAVNPVCPQNPLTVRIVRIRPNHRRVANLQKVRIRLNRVQVLNHLKVASRSLRNLQSHRSRVTAVNRQSPVQVFQVNRPIVPSRPIRLNHPKAVSPLSHLNQACPLIRVSAVRQKVRSHLRAVIPVNLLPLRRVLIALNQVLPVKVVIRVSPLIHLYQVFPVPVNLRRVLNHPTLQFRQKAVNPLKVQSPLIALNQASHLNHQIRVLALNPVFPVSPLSHLIQVFPVPRLKVAIPV